MSRSPLKFFLLVFAFSIPFWLIGAFTGLQLSPGFPVSSLMVVSPLVAALILVYRENETAGVTALLKRSFDYKRIGEKVWYVPIVLLMPGLFVLAYGLMRLMGLPLPTPQFPVLAALVMLLVFFVAALSEEIGWSGYVIDPMQARSSIQDLASDSLTAMGEQHQRGREPGRDSSRTRARVTSPYLLSLAHCLAD